MLTAAAFESQASRNNILVFIFLFGLLRHWYHHWYTIKYDKLVEIVRNVKTITPWPILGHEHEVFSQFFSKVISNVFINICHFIDELIIN